MRNQTALDVRIPDIVASFVGGRGEYGFKEATDDFDQAQEVHILTYSGINGKMLKKLMELKDKKLNIIVALPGAKFEKHAKSVERELEKNKKIFDVDMYSSQNVEIGVCLENHAKIIGTENILYIGSANYSNYSRNNYEAGVIIKDKETIKKIYNEYYDKIVAVQLKDDYWDIKIKILQIESDLEMLSQYACNFGAYFEDREKNANSIKNIYEALMENVDEVVDELAPSDVDEVVDELESPEKVLKKYRDNMYEAASKLGEIEDIFLSITNSGYDKGIEYFADAYEERYKEEKGVYSDDAYVSKDELYVRLSECEDMEYYISKYWEEEWDEKIDEILDIINNAKKEIDQIIMTKVYKDSYEKLKKELINVCSDENAKKEYIKAKEGEIK